MTDPDALPKETREQLDLLWQRVWSPSRRKAFIVNGNGSTIVGPLLTAALADKLVYEHNRALAKGKYGNG